MTRLALIALLLASCGLQPVAQPTAGPTDTPPPSASAAASPSPSPAASPTSAARTLPPFARVTQLSIPSDSYFVAPDRSRVAYSNGATVSVVELSTGASRAVYQAPQGWGIQLDRSALQDDLLVFEETRIDVDQEHVRVMRADLRTSKVDPIDEFVSPSFGGGDTWHPRAPITNGTDIAWLRTTQTEGPFTVDVVLLRSGASPVVVRSARSIMWLDLDDGGHVLVSTFVTPQTRAELYLFPDAVVLGDRPSDQGGPAGFVGSRAFWAIGPGIVRNIVSGEYVDLSTKRRDRVDLGCGYVGSTLQHVAASCQTGWQLQDATSGTRYDLPGAVQSVGRRAVVWREGTETWVGTL